MKKEKVTDKYKAILILIIILAILIRIYFIYKTDISKYQSDMGIGELNSEEDYDNLYHNFYEEPNKGRHINYILHLYTYGTLPNEIIGQFYHPPLHHFIMSSWLKLMDNFTDISSFKFESMQIVPLAYSIIMLFALYKILQELEIDNKNKIISMIMFSFYPLFIIMSGSLNNDELVTMFSVISLLYLIKWEKNPNMKNAVIIALSIGIGLMTKTSITVMIIPSIYVYFKKLSEFVKNDKSVILLLCELLIFMVIVGVLGLWFHIYSLTRGLNTIGIIQPYEYLSVAGESIWNRFGIPNLLEISSSNIWNYLIYSSIDYGLLGKVNIYYFVIAILITILSINEIYYMIKYNSKNRLLIYTFIAWWISYFYLNISMPYTCSMHARYMMIPSFIGIAFLSIGLQNEKNKILKKQIYICTIILSILSVISFL